VLGGLVGVAGLVGLAVVVGEVGGVVPVPVPPLIAATWPVTREEKSVPW